ncbi:MAG: hypothetical protein SGPRY_014818 [Prymnesium sp.]
MLYTHFQVMETDVFPYRPLWLEAIAQLSVRRSRVWVRGSPSLCLSEKETEHINGNGAPFRPLPPIRVEVRTAAHSS